jgi:tRNA threonylcarbamoyladenosine biosynthesis protein TsaB
MGEVLGKPVIAVSNLEALAWYGTAELRATVIDARRGEIFGALFEQSGGQVIPEMVISFPKFLELLANREFEWVSTDFGPFRDSLRGAQLTLAPRALAGSIARIAMRRLAAGANADPAGVDANYVRRSDAELLWKEQ